MSSAETLKELKEIKKLEHLRPETWIGLNAEGRIVKIRKYVQGEWWEREIDDPDVVNKNVVKWIKLSSWKKITV